MAPDLDKFPMFSHGMTNGHAPFYPGTIPPRRMRSSAQVNPYLGGKVDLENDSRLVYHYDISAGSDNFIYPDDRVWGWLDRSQNEFHLNYWNYGAYSTKPYWYSGSSPNNIFNNEPFLYFHGVNEKPPTQPHDCGIYRWDSDVRDYVTALWGASPPNGYLFMGVFYMYLAQHWWSNDWGDLTADNHVSITCPRTFLSYRRTSSKLPPYCSVLYSDGLYSPIATAPWIAEPVVIARWFNPREGLITGDNAYGKHILRINGETHSIKDHNATSTFNNPQFDLAWLWFGACYRMDIDYPSGYKHSERWAMTKTFLGIGDYTIQEIMYLETQWMNRYNIRRRSSPEYNGEFSWSEIYE